MALNKKLVAAGAGLILVSAVVIRTLLNTGHFEPVTAVCDLRQDPTDGGRPVFYTQQIRGFRLRADAGLQLFDGGRVLADGGDLEREYPGLTGGWVVPDPLIDDDSTPIHCTEVTDDATLDAGMRRLISGLCACSPYLPDGGHPALCQWNMALPDGGWSKAPGDQTLAADHWRGVCVAKVCVVADGDQDKDMPDVCRP